MLNDGKTIVLKKRQIHILKRQIISIRIEVNYTMEKQKRIFIELPENIVSKWHELAKLNYASKKGLLMKLIEEAFEKEINKK